jgi:hypothetical protein
MHANNVFMIEVKKTMHSRQASPKPFLKHRRNVFLIILSLGALLFWYQTREFEISRTVDPSGKYIAIVSYQRWQKPYATTPGNGGSHAGYIRIETVNGKDLGMANLPILWMADDMRWRENGATLVGSGIWDFKTGKCEQWE